MPLMLPPMEDAPCKQAHGKSEPKRKAKDRFADVNAFVDFTMADLSSSAVRDWLVLWRDTKRATGLAKTGQSDLARRSGMCKRQVIRALAELNDAGLLKVVRQGRINAGPSVYRVRGINPA